MECLFCGSNSLKKAAYPRKTFFNNKEFAYKECNNCHLVFINPLPNADDYKLMYSPEYHETFYFNAEPVDHSYLDEPLSLANGNKNFLDYGCGDGSVLKYCFEKGLNCFGAEYDKSFVEKLRGLYPEMTFHTIEELWSSETTTYNFIHLGDVLEHIDKPIEFLKKILGKLEPVHGRLIVRGPLENNKSLSLLLRKATSWVVEKATPGKIASHVPYHISFSNAENQLALFNRTGYEMVSYELDEWNWPYPDYNKGTIAEKIKYQLALLSRRVSKVNPRSLGNRFVYIGKRKPDSTPIEHP